MRGRQRLGVVAQVVLAELAGVVAEIEQELGERRRAGPQVGRAARELRRDHAGAQRMHPGEEGIAAGRATLLGVVVHEDRTFLPNAVDVGGFPHHQAAVIDARLHPADVIAHDEENVGLLLLLRGCWHARRHRGNQQREQAEAEPLGHTHGLFPQFWLPEPGRQPVPGDNRAERSARWHECNPYCAVRLGRPCTHVPYCPARSRIPAIRVSPDKWVRVVLISFWAGNARNSLAVRAGKAATRGSLATVRPTFFRGRWKAARHSVEFMTTEGGFLLQADGRAACDKSQPC
jgi:hypothetical protein